MFRFLSLAVIPLALAGAASADGPKLKDDGTPYPPVKVQVTVTAPKAAEPPAPTEGRVVIVGEAKPRTPVRTAVKAVGKAATKRAAKGVWLADPEGSCDCGYYVGETFVGRYQPYTGLYLPYDARAGTYLQPVQLTAPRPPVGQRRQCTGNGCVLITLYSTAPPEVDPPE